jgi:hypothetical protein
MVLMLIITTTSSSSSFCYLAHCIECIGRSTIPLDYLMNSRKLVGWQTLKPAPQASGRHANPSQEAKVNIMVELLDVRGSVVQYHPQCDTD